MNKEQKNIVRLFNTSNPNNWDLAYQLSKNFYPQLKAQFDWLHERRHKVGWYTWFYQKEYLAKMLFGNKKSSNYIRASEIEIHLSGIYETENQAL